jgi:hypothetical protein
MTLGVPWGFEVSDAIGAITFVVTGSNDLAVILKYM